MCEAFENRLRPVNVIYRLFSDPHCLTFYLSGSLPRPRKSKKLVYAYRKADWEYLKSLFSRTPLHCAYFDDNLDDNWQAWLDLFFEWTSVFRSGDTTINLIPAWLSKELLKLCRKKKSLFRKSKQVNSDLLWMRYRTLNNSVKKACNAAKRNYINDLADELATNNNPTPFWSFVKSMRKGSNNFVSLNVDGVTLSNDLSIVESMNDFFSSVFTSEGCHNFPKFEYVTNSKISNILCNTKEVEKLLKNLNIYKSPGPDCLPPRILKECASVVSSPLCFFFNKSFSTGKLPHLWKLANITTLLKKGNKTDRNNYHDRGENR